MSVSIVAIMASAMLGGTMVANLVNVYPPYANQVKRKTYKGDPNVLPSLNELVTMRYREIISQDVYQQTALEHGFDFDNSENIFNSVAQLLMPIEYVTLWRREKIDESTLDNILNKLRISPDDITRLKQVTEYFPQAQDLITFAVREVYSPEIVSKFGQKEDLPDQFVTEAKKIGIAKDQAENYWAAHWALPSPLQGFEMFHRDVIDEDTLKMLLKALDIMPFWRDSMIAISYNPLTRVDVRRMHKLGVLDDEGVKRAYQDVGYSPDNADKMLEFTKLYNADDISGITRANVVSAYKDDIISETQLFEYLGKMGLADDVVDFWMSVANYQKDLRAQKAEEKALTKLHSKGALSTSGLRNSLVTIEVPTTRIDRTVKDAVRTKQTKVRMPSKAELETWLTLEIIDEVQYSDYMQGLGYRQDEIPKYLMQFTLEKDTTKRKYLPIKTYLRWEVSGIISTSQFLALGKEMRISLVDLDLMLAEADRSINELVG